MSPLQSKPTWDQISFVTPQYNHLLGGIFTLIVTVIQSAESEFEKG